MTQCLYAESLTNVEINLRNRNRYIGFKNN